MKRTALTLMAAGATAFLGILMLRNKSSEREEPNRIIKETFWSKLRELWAIRRRCREIELQRRQNRPAQSNEFSASFLSGNSAQTTNFSR
jgi:hypothetical protein